jgi:hypothetical protein
MNRCKKIITIRISGEMYCQQIFQNLLGRRASPNISAISSQKLSTPKNRPIKINQNKIVSLP